MVCLAMERDIQLYFKKYRLIIALSCNLCESPLLCTEVLGTKLFLSQRAFCVFSYIS